MKAYREKKNSFLQYLIALTAACLVFGIMQGTKDNYGIMMNGIINHTGISYAAVSFAIGVGQIMYGVTQPLFAMLALKKSNAFVLLCGIMLMAAGLIGPRFAHRSGVCFCFLALFCLPGQGRFVWAL